MIEWHKETWYSDLASFVVLFIGLPVLFFYIGLRYVEVSKTNAAAESATLNAIQSLSKEYATLTASSTARSATSTPR